MRIYEVVGAEGFMQFQLKDYEKDSKYINLLSEDGSIEDRWKTLDVDVVTKGKKSDFPFFWGGIRLIVVSKEATIELEDLCESQQMEFLPLKSQDEVYYIIHIINSEKISFSPDEEDYADIIFKKQECIEHNVMEKYLFRGCFMGKRANSSIFITEKLINRIKNSTLKGFNCKKIWEA